MFESVDLWTMISLAIGVIASVLAVFWGKAKIKLNQVKSVVKESSDVVTVAVEALGDDKLTAEEIAAIKVEALEAVAAIKLLFTKIETEASVE